MEYPREGGGGGGGGGGFYVSRAYWGWPRGGCKRSGDAGLLAERDRAACVPACCQPCCRRCEEPRGGGALRGWWMRSCACCAWTPTRRPCCTSASPSTPARPTVSEHTTLEKPAAESGVSAGRGAHLACQPQICSASTSRQTMVPWVPGTLVTAHCCFTRCASHLKPAVTRHIHTMAQQQRSCSCQQGCGVPRQTNACGS